MIVNKKNYGMSVIALSFVITMHLQAIGNHGSEWGQTTFIRVTVTAQTFNFVRPWEKKRPTQQEAIGTVIGPNQVLVTAALVANATFIELERIGRGSKCPATIIQVDYSANIALLRPSSPDYLRTFTPADVCTDPMEIGDTLEVWQFESNGIPVRADAEIKGIEVQRYPYESARLVFHLKVLLSEVGGGYTLPVMRNRKLAGLLMRHNPGRQRVTIVPYPVINHFIKDFEDGSYQGFPQAGFNVSPLEDPQLRGFLGIDQDDVGVFVEEVRPNSPAENAGLEANDVLLSIGKFDIDTLGQYDDPDFGKLSIAHFTTTRSYAGDTHRIRIIRDGLPRDLDITLEPLTPEDHPIPPYIIDRPPRFIIVGGLVFQELSGQYLMEWGANWKTSAPQRFIHYQRYQWDLVQPDERVVILSHVLKSERNVGYETLSYLIVTDVNNTKIKKLEDIVAALKDPINGFQEIKFKDDPKVIYLDASTLRDEDELIKSRYDLPRLFRLANDNAIPITPMP